MVYEQVLGEEKFTFVEDVANPKSVTILVTGESADKLQRMFAYCGTGFTPIQLM